MTDTAVVLLNYNGRELLRKFLPSVIEHSGKASIVVVDNGSSDGSLQLVKEQFPGVACIRLEVNRGFCGGYNAALKQIPASVPDASNHSRPLGRNTPPSTAPRNDPAVVVPVVPQVVVVPVPPEVVPAPPVVVVVMPPFVGVPMPPVPLYYMPPFI